MAVRIRLKRIGKIHHPIYRVVVVDSRKKRDGRVIEEVGKYDPNQEPSLIELESERIQYWLGVGAQPSDAVHRFLVLSGDWAKFKGAKNVENRIRTKDEGDDVAAAIKAADDAAEKAKAKKAEAEAKAKKEAEAAKAAAESEKAAEGTPAEEAPAEEKAE
ncbi:30S ribosomal protein S16 [Mobiluncus mulieris]|uniref:Small ribosomal subunit protein bS16 n=2 Tax=Mobiluncus mulieris TaxID=2052 RepID=E0QSZ5_9ACTO|nr:30S ribosomal protein S16 [Mobiluncus mulieris]EEZ90441.1 ribosomal protein S16 [Mobiluncus mulieris 28-1]EFM45334.1 ribosomal protein S16 [Mobiluncus mulieris ATCC 35239]EFN93846.1 ribosomal protein S16 [Mobiluncus mulieris FB024-16]MBB5845575.1 small subunit ribosomal protein S16 [Mobiluncus mulieris]MCU9969389.1 30S ribosomal protein S16 [Mobiluncus mulieris]